MSFVMGPRLRTSKYRWNTIFSSLQDIASSFTEGFNFLKFTKFEHLQAKNKKNKTKGKDTQS